jgi:hypothetical protein
MSFTKSTYPIKEEKHSAQIQALFWASSGTRSRSTVEKVAAMHQQDA